MSISCNDEVVGNIFCYLLVFMFSFVKGYQHWRVACKESITNRRQSKYEKLPAVGICGIVRQVESPPFSGQFPFSCQALVQVPYREKGRLAIWKSTGSYISIDLLGRGWRGRGIEGVQYAYIEYQSSSSELGPPTSTPASGCVSPLDPKGGGHSDDCTEKRLALCILQGGVSRIVEIYRVKGGGRAPPPSEAGPKIPS